MTIVEKQSPRTVKQFVGEQQHGGGPLSYEQQVGVLCKKVLRVHPADAIVLAKICTPELHLLWRVGDHHRTPSELMEATVLSGAIPPPSRAASLHEKAIVVRIIVSSRGRHQYAVVVHRRPPLKFRSSTSAETYKTEN